MLQADGDIVETDGVSPLAFTVTDGDSYYVVVKHRNHLAVMTDTTYPINQGALIDFTNPTTGTFGTGSQAIQNGIMMLYSADANGDGSVNAADRAITWNDRNQSGYLLSDVNLSGSVNAGDRSLTWNGRNKFTQVP